MSTVVKTKEVTENLQKGNCSYGRVDSFWYNYRIGLFDHEYMIQIKGRIILRL